MIIHYDQLDSTNRLAKELVTTNQATAGTVIRAAMQSAGKGQYGRSFASPPGGLYFSLILRPDLARERLPLITLATGLACRSVIQTLYGLQPQIKWPNDLYLGQQKLAGILCEQIASGAGEQAEATVIIGVGLNGNSWPTDFDTELSPLLTTLRAHLQQEVDLDVLLSHLLAAITATVAMLADTPDEVLGQWQQYDYLLGQPVLHTSGTARIDGIGMGITSQGHYRIVDHLGADHVVLGGWLRPQPLPAGPPAPQEI